LFEEEPKVTVTLAEDKIIINDTNIALKSLIPKYKNSNVDIKIPDEYKLAYPNNENIKYILSDVFD
jgi:hypothetical protein